MIEEWRKIQEPSVPKDLKHYEVSSKGRVRRGSFIEPLHVNEKGSIDVHLVSDTIDSQGSGSSGSYPVDRLVAAAFLLPYRQEKPLLHYDGNIENNDCFNLFQSPHSTVRAMDSRNKGVFQITQSFSMVNDVKADDHHKIAGQRPDIIIVDDIMDADVYQKL